ncbi:MAG: response regulator [Acidobacteriota bacterium]
MASSGGASVKIFMITEHAALRQSVEMLLAEEGMVFGPWADDAASALRALPAGADVVIVGLSGGGEGGLALLREVASRPNFPPCIVLSVNDDDASIRRALAAGARGYVTNREAPEVLAGVIREVIAGRTCAPRLKVVQE